MFMSLRESGLVWFSFYLFFVWDITKSLFLYWPLSGLKSSTKSEISQLRFKPTNHLMLPWHRFVSLRSLHTKDGFRVLNSISLLPRGFDSRSNLMSKAYGYENPNSGASRIIRLSTRVPGSRCRSSARLRWMQREPNHAKSTAAISHKLCNTLRRCTSAHCCEP